MFIIILFIYVYVILKWAHMRILRNVDGAPMCNSTSNNLTEGHNLSRIILRQTVVHNHDYSTHCLKLISDCQ